MLLVPVETHAFMPSGSVVIHLMNSAAAAVFLAPFGMTKEEPPYMADAGLPSQVGTGATDHLPFWSATVACWAPAHQLAQT